jgi:uncharacterized protein (TIGR02118 family)
MVRLITHLKRRVGMDPEEFQRHWRERHGPLVREKLGHHIVRYEQYPPVEGQDWDGVAMIWFDSPADFDAFVADPAYMSDVFPDEQAFLDHGGLTFQIVHDEPRVIIAEATP